MGFRRDNLELEPKDYSGIISFYASYIDKGIIKIDDIAEVFREEVQKELDTLKGGE